MFLKHVASGDTSACEETSITLSQSNLKVAERIAFCIALPHLFGSYSFLTKKT